MCQYWDLRSRESFLRLWHAMQDNGYLHPESWKVLQVTAWMPLVNATVQNGCMQVIRGGHRAGKTCKHSCCVGGTWCALLTWAQNLTSTHIGLQMKGGALTLLKETALPVCPPAA